MKATTDIRLDNLKLLIEEAGGVPELSKKAGYTQPSYIYQIINRTAIQNGKPKNIGANMARKLEAAMNKPEFWLDEEHKPIESNSTILGSFEEWDSNTPLADDDCEIPFYKDIHLAAGSGFSDDIEDYNGYKLRFAKSTLRKQGVVPSNAVCVSASGNSMEPVIPDGTTLGINTADKNIKDGKIYAINHGGLLRTKILYRLPDNKIRIRSYNQEEHPDEEVSADAVSIIGRVFWWSVLD